MAATRSAFEMSWPAAANSSSREDDLYRSAARMGSEALTVSKARTAVGAKKMTLQKPKQQQTPVNNCKMFFMKHGIFIVLANIFVQ
jgi:hypothetical protein